MAVPGTRGGGTEFRDGEMRALSLLPSDMLERLALLPSTSGSSWSAAGAAPARDSVRRARARVTRRLPPAHVRVRLSFSMMPVKKGPVIEDTRALCRCMTPCARDAAAAGAAHGAAPARA